VKHRETHPNLDVEGCFGCRVAGIRMGTNSTTSRGAKVSEIKQTERNWNKDMPAYKRLRANGLQPKKIDGAAEVEKKAQESWQVETGILPNI
jgi:glycine/serine hydroxymethyltransferase